MALITALAFSAIRVVHGPAVRNLQSRFPENTFDLRPGKQMAVASDQLPVYLPPDSHISICFGPTQAIAHHSEQSSRPSVLRSIVAMIYIDKHHSARAQAFSCLSKNGYPLLPVFQMAQNIPEAENHVKPALRHWNLRSPASPAGQRARPARPHVLAGFKSKHVWDAGRLCDPDCSGPIAGSNIQQGIGACCMRNDDSLDRCQVAVSRSGYGVIGSSQ